MQCSELVLELVHLVSVNVVLTGQVRVTRAFNSVFHAAGRA
jgi:hypothetical protein